MSTEAKPQETGRLITPVFRLSFPQVFTPKAVVAGQEAKYSISMLFPKKYTPELLSKFKGPEFTVEHQEKLMQGLRDAVKAAAVAKWGADPKKWPTKKETVDGQVVERSAIVSPWHDGAEKDYDGYGPDWIYASASSKIKPGLADQKLQPITTQDDLYGGAWCRASVTVFAYDNKKMGVSFGLRNVQKLRDDERFGGGAAPDKDFTPIEVAAAPAQGSNATAAGAPAADPLGI